MSKCKQKGKSVGTSFRPLISPVALPPESAFLYYNNTTVIFGDFLRTVPSDMLGAFFFDYGIIGSVDS